MRTKLFSISVLEAACHKSSRKKFDRFNGFCLLIVSHLLNLSVSSGVRCLHGGRSSG